MTATTRIASLHLLLAILAFALCASCNKTPAPKAERIPEPYANTPNAVKFDILPVGSSQSGHAWIANYTDGQRSTRFRLEFNDDTGKGQFTSEPNSDPTILLESLKPALQAKRIPHNIVHVDALRFTFVVLGQNQKRQSDGTFIENGNWTPMKIALGKDEVYLNINPVDAVAEFAMKDPRDGDAVVAQLAKVF